MIIANSHNKVSSMLLGKIFELSFLYPVIEKLLLEYIYINKISVLYSYVGQYYDPNMTKMWLSWIPVIMFSILRKCLNNTMLAQCFNVMFFVSAIPSFSLFWLKNENSVAFVLLVLYWAIWWLVTFILTNRKHNRIIEKVKFDNISSFLPETGNEILVVVFLFSIITTCFFSAIYGNFRVFIPFQDVYDYRLASENRMGIFAYIYLLNTRVLIPLCFCVHLMRNNFLFSSIDALLLLLSYGIYGDKSFFLTIFLIIGIVTLHRFNLLKRLDSLIFFIIAFLFILLFFSNILDMEGGNWLIFFIYRVFTCPAEGHYNYYDFFSQSSAPFLYLSEGIFRHFVDSPYFERVSIIIGSSRNYYFSGNYNNFNNGLMSIAYANFGIIGVLLHPFFIVSSFYWYFKIIGNYNCAIQFVFILLNAFYLISSTYFSWLLSGGLIFQMIVLYLVSHCKSTINNKGSVID